MRKSLTKYCQHPKKKFFVFLLLILGISVLKTTAQDIVINEVEGANTSVIKDEDGSSSDWIELYNWGDTPIDLSGFGISNKKSEPLKWVSHRLWYRQKDFYWFLLRGKTGKPFRCTPTLKSVHPVNL